MKKLYFLATAVLMTFGLHSQTQAQAAPDTTEITVGKGVITITQDAEDHKKVMYSRGAPGSNEGYESEPEEKKKDNVETKFAALDLGFNLLMFENSLNLPPSLELLETKTFNSTNVGLHLLPTKFNIIKHKVNLQTGITFDFNDFAFAHPVTVLPDMDTLTLVRDSISYKKSKLKTAHLQVPLMLNFQTNPDNERKNFHISVGGYAGILLGAKTKQKSEEFGKVKISDDFNLEKFRYGVTARLGYRNLEFYANYNLSSMFRDDQGPEIIPLSIGIALTGAL